MSEITPEKFNNIYKRLFKKYFDKPLKEDGFYKKGSINFYRLNKIGMLEGLNFQRNYDELTVNYYVIPTWCASTKNTILIGDRLGNFIEKGYWWKLRNEEEMEENMLKILKMIQTELSHWFKKMENENEIIKAISNSYLSTIIYQYITQATTMAKFKKYNEIPQYIEKVKKEYSNYVEKEKEREWLQNIIKEALYLEKKLKDGNKAVEEYIIEREKQSLRELGLEKLID